MNTLSIAVVLALLSSGPPPSDPLLWGDDILVWDMTGSTTWLGDGYTYCNSIYDPDGGLYTASVMDVTGGQGDLLRVYISSDNGQSWTMGGFTTGGTWELYDPEFTISSGAPDYMLLYYTALQTGQPGMAIVARYLLPGFSLLDGYVIDYSNPAADEIRSQAVARDPASGTIWHFINDASDQLFLSKSTDDGETWSSSELVTGNVTRHSAAAGPGGRIFVAYQEATGSQDIRCIVLTESGSTITTVAGAAADAAPVPACEWSGAQIDLGIVYHDAGGNIRLAVSQDYGQSWNSPVNVAQGSYPFIDIYPGRSKVCMAFINSAGTGVMASRASGIPGLASASFTVRTDQTPSAAGPPVVRYSTQTSAAEIYGLFYMGEGPGDLWYDNSILTGIAEPEDEGLDVPVMSLEPNPFTGSATIHITLASPEQVELSVYSLEGRLVQHVYSGITENGSFQAGESLPSGVYTVVLGTGSGTTTLRMVKL
jgi:hypothetical protein